MTWLSHINLCARDGRRLAAFYEAVFGCEAQGGGWRRLSGPAIDCGNGLPDSEIEALWLGLPGGGPYLEIFQYRDTAHRPEPAVNEPGYGHLCLVVPDIEAAMAAIQAAGGAAQGEVVRLGSADAPVLCVYMRDPEGNLIELEQRPE